MIKDILPKKTTIIFVFLLLFTGISSFISSYVPQVNKIIIDQGIIAGNQNIIIKFLIILFCLTLINSVIKYINNISINNMGLNVAKNLKKKVIYKVFNSPLNFFDKISCGELVQRIKEVDAISGVFTPQLITIVIAIVTSSIAMIKIININYRFIFIYIVAFPSIGYISYRLSRFYRRMTFDIVNLNTKSSQIVHESISGISEIKSFNILLTRQGEINKIHQEIYQKTKKQNSIYTFSSELLVIINVLVSIAVTVIFANLFQDKEASIGQYIELTQYSALILAPAQLISTILTIIQPVLVIIKRIKYFESTEEQNNTLGEDINIIDTIRFDKVTFSYDDNKVLDNLSFGIKNNEKVLISGANGSGKTTLTKLLLRLYDNYVGHICFNNKDAKSYSIQSIRREIAVVFQNTFLFDGSLYDNIICGDTNITKEAVVDAIKKSGITHNMADMHLDELLAIPIVEGGKNLSGGQKRMIAIARALVRKPSVLILDEPTTFLDKESKDSIIRFIQTMEEMIIIVISHDDDVRKIMDRKVEL